MFVEMFIVKGVRSELPLYKDYEDNSRSTRNYKEITKSRGVRVGEGRDGDGIKKILKNVPHSNVLKFS